MGDVLVVCGQGVAPAAASIDCFRDRGLDLVPGTGLLAACVPGAFDAWMLLLRDFGTLGLRDVLEPAIDYAEGGFPVVPGITATIAGMEGRFRDEWPTSAETYLPASAARHALPQPGARRHVPPRARDGRGGVRGARGPDRSCA